MARRPQTDEYDDEEVRPRRRRAARKSSPLLWVGLAVGGGLLVLVAGGAIAFVLLSKGGKAQPNADIVRMPGLLAYWSFDDVAGDAVKDHSPRGNQAKLVGGSLGAGARGQSLLLDDVADHYCDFSTSADFNFAANAEFTFAGWFSTSQPSATLLSLRNSRGLSNPQIDLLVREGKVEVIVSDDNDQAGRNGVVWAKQRNDGQWHHFAFTRRANTVELFLDGASQGQNTAAGVGGPITTDLRALGCERLWAQQNDRRWGDPSVRGGIDEVCIFGRALTPAEIKTLMAR